MAEIRIRNNMTAKYKLEAHRESSIPFELLVGNYKDSTLGFTINPKTIQSRHVPFNINVKYGNNADLGFNITPKINKYMGFSIDVNPHNTMYARYEMIPPPITEWEGFPVQDSYTLSQSPYSSINYGGNNSMLLGNGNRGHGQPFVQFDLSTIPRDARIKSATFRLYYNNLNTPNIDLFRVDEKWSEYNITYLNQPSNTSFITDNYSVDEKGRFIEFSVTDTVIYWIKSSTNNGLTLKSSDGNTTIFSTRESFQSPELLVEHFNNDPVNIGNSRQPFSVQPSLYREINQRFDVSIVTRFRQSDLGFKLFAHDVNYYYPTNMPFTIVADERVLRNSRDDLAFKIDVPGFNISDMPFELFVPTFERDSNMLFSITPILSSVSHLGFELTANRDYKYQDSYIGFKILSQGRYKIGHTDLGFEFTSIDIRTDKFSDLGFIIEPQFSAQALQEFNIQVKGYESDNSSVGFEITAKEAGESGIILVGFSIVPRVESDSLQRFNIDVTRPPIGTASSQAFQINARKFIVNDMLFEITVNSIPRKSYSRIYII